MPKPCLDCVITSEGLVPNPLNNFGITVPMTNEAYVIICVFTLLR